MTCYPFDLNWNEEMAADYAAYSDMREEFGHLTLWNFIKYFPDEPEDYLEALEPDDLTPWL
jgi:hypothetical protein